ncbi:hypothetical protein QQ045_012163 [Rhodiola kirilowii]
MKREKTSDADTTRLRTVKRERLSKNNSGNGRGVRGEEEREEERLRSVTRERLCTNSGGNGEEGEVERLRTVKRQRLSRNGGDGEEQNGDNDDGGDEQVGTTRDRAVDRRELRSRYTAVKNLINSENEKDDLNNVDSDKFHTIIREVDNLHQLVQKPREQVADAEALLGISSTLMTSVKSHSNRGLTPKDFFSGLIEKFSNHNGHQAENAQLSIDWEVIGSAVSKVIRTSDESGYFYLLAFVNGSNLLADVVYGNLLVNMQGKAITADVESIEKHALCSMFMASSPNRDPLGPLETQFTRATSLPLTWLLHSTVEPSPAQREASPAAVTEEASPAQREAAAATEVEMEVSGENEWWGKCKSLGRLESMNDQQSGHMAYERGLYSYVPISLLQIYFVTIFTSAT